MEEARHGQVLRPGRVYVAPPDQHLEVRGRRLHLQDSAKVRFSRPSIDVLFQSLAESFLDQAVAVLLSGSGTDGVEGMLKVKEADGTTVAEDRTTADYPAMPEAASRVGAVDFVLPVDRIPEFLAKLCKGELPRIREGHWAQLLAVMRKRFGTDFSAYKTSTLHRRLEKRLLATGVPDLGGYLKLVQRKPQELEELHGAFLIKVSSFFRDKDAWKKLFDDVIKPLARGAKPGQEIRVWSAGCATGEEAYTLAMLFLEALKEPEVNLKVFATDIDDQALEMARQGLYDQAQVTEVPPPMRRRYFEQDGRSFRVRKELRKQVIFGKHDLLRDPPIAGLDLLVCRNVLIYFNQDQKQTLMARLAYALKPGGFLFLGKSEGIIEVEGTLEPVSTKTRIFRKGAARYLPPPVLLNHAGPGAMVPQDQLRQAMEESVRGFQAQETFTHLLLQSATVMLITVDAARRITLWNRAAEQLFGTPASKALGKPFFEVMEGVSTDRLAKAIKRSLSELSTVELRDVPCKQGERSAAYLDLDVTPLLGKQGDGSALLVGVNVTARHEAEARQRELLQKVRKGVTETARANETLQSANEELETLNEELQSAAEEQQTLNEELQSANEELETTNEELQSTNEELSTLNEEMRVRTEELERVTGYLRGVLDSAPDALVVCDEDNQVTFWSHAATQLFRLSDAQAVGRELFDLVPMLDVQPMRDAVRQVRQRKEPVVVEDLPLGQGPRVRVSLSMVGDRAGRARGFVLAASDVTSRAAREEEVRRGRDLLNVYNQLLTHDLANIAAGMAAHLDRAREAKPEAAQGHLLAAEGLLKRASGLMRNVQLLGQLGPGRGKARAVDARAAAAEALETVRLAFPDADAKLANDVPAEARVAADPTLAQVFFNVLANAVEHGGDGVEVRASAQRATLDSRPAWAITVRDDGPGMSPALRERIFAGPPGTPPGGPGLGLYVTRALVEQWGGTVRAEVVAHGSARGTEVCITLPEAASGKGKARREP